MYMYMYAFIAFVLYFVILYRSILFTYILMLFFIYIERDRERMRRKTHVNKKHSEGPHDRFEVMYMTGPKTTRSQNVSSL